MVKLFLCFIMHDAMKMYENAQVWFLSHNTVCMEKKPENVQHGCKGRTLCCCCYYHTHSNNMEKPSFSVITYIWSVKVMTETGRTYHTTLLLLMLHKDLPCSYSITRGCESSVNAMTGLHARQATNWPQNRNQN